MNKTGEEDDRQKRKDVATVELCDIPIRFVVESRLLGAGSSIFAWSPTGEILAASGSTRVVHLLDVDCNIVDQIVPPSPSKCVALEWDAKGEILCVVQDGSKTLVFWDARDHSVEYVDMPVKDIVLASSSPLVTSPTVVHQDDIKEDHEEEDHTGFRRQETTADAKLLVLVTSRGKMLLYNREKRLCLSWDTGPKTAGFKNRSEQLKWFVYHPTEEGADKLLLHQRLAILYACESVLCVYQPSDGEVLEKVNFKAKIIDIGLPRGRRNCVSLTLDDGSLVLHSPQLFPQQNHQHQQHGVGKRRSDSIGSAQSLESHGSGSKSKSTSSATSSRRKTRGNSAVGVSSGTSTSKQVVKLQFQPGYGRLCGVSWFAETHFVVGFANGSIIALSATQLDHEKARTRYIKKDLQHFTSDGETLVTYGDGSLHIFDLQTWKLQTIQKHSVDQFGRVDTLSFNSAKGLIGLSTDTGNIICFQLRKQHDTNGEVMEPIDLSVFLKKPVSKWILISTYVGSFATVICFLSLYLNVRLSILLRILF